MIGEFPNFEATSIRAVDLQYSGDLTRLSVPVDERIAVALRRSRRAYGKLTVDVSSVALSAAVNRPNTRLVSEPFGSFPDFFLR